MSDFNDNDLEAMLTETFGPPPVADVDAWRQRRPWALACLNPQRTSIVAIRRKRMNRLLILAATAGAAICVWLGFGGWDSTVTGPSTSAFAQAIEQIQKAKTIKWKDTVYVCETSKDHRRHWYTTTVFVWVYKSPGLCRTTALDKKGDVVWEEISDSVHKRVLTLYPLQKIATIAESGSDRGPEDKFLNLQERLNRPNLQFIEKRRTPNGDVNVFRRVEGKCFFDYWIEQKSKRLVEYRINQNEHITLADYQNDPMRDAASEKETAGGSIVGSITNEIVYDADLDDTLFRFDVPKGYAVETKKLYHVSEQEMIDYFRILAEFNEGIFPHDLSQPNSDRLNKYRKQPKAERPAAAQKLIETVRHYDKIGLRELPLRAFLREKGEWTSYRYFGNGVKLGNTDAIICWYRLKDARDPTTYRVVYGDLSVRDVAAKDLPLPVAP